MRDTLHLYHLNLHHHHRRCHHTGNSRAYSYFLMYYMEENGEWELLSTVVSTGYFSDGGMTQFGRTYFTFTFRRRWQFYGLNLVRIWIRLILLDLYLHPTTLLLKQL